MKATTAAYACVFNLLGAMVHYSMENDPAEERHFMVRINGWNVIGAEELVHSTQSTIFQPPFPLLSNTGTIFKEWFPVCTALSVYLNNQLICILGTQTS